MQTKHDDTVRVNVGAIIDQIHTRYSKQIATLVQENAEVAAANDQLVQQVAELEARLAAQHDSGQILGESLVVPDDGMGWPDHQ